MTLSFSGALSFEEFNLQFFDPLQPDRTFVFWDQFFSGSNSLDSNLVSEADWPSVYEQFSGLALPQQRRFKYSNSGEQIVAASDFSEVSTHCVLCLLAVQCLKLCAFDAVPNAVFVEADAMLHRSQFTQYLVQKVSSSLLCGLMALYRSVQIPRSQTAHQRPPHSTWSGSSYTNLLPIGETAVPVRSQSSQTSS